MRVRLLYLGDMAKKLMSMDYAHFENAKFFEEYEKGMQAGNNNNNGIEGLYNKLSELPGKFLSGVLSGFCRNIRHSYANGSAQHGAGLPGNHFPYNRDIHHIRCKLIAASKFQSVPQQNTLHRRIG